MSSISTLKECTLSKDVFKEAFVHLCEASSSLRDFTTDILDNQKIVGRFDVFKNVPKLLPVISLYSTLIRNYEYNVDFRMIDENYSTIRLELSNIVNDLIIESSGMYKSFGKKNLLDTITELAKISTWLDLLWENVQI